jgi:hypothetical protein
MLNETHGIDITQNNKIAIKYKINDTSLFINGVEIYSTTIMDGFLANTLTSLQLNSGAGNSIFYGKTKAIKVYKTALSDDELRLLTLEGRLPAWSSYSQMAVDLEYTVK